MIKQDKLYTVAGTATGANGVTKVRWANDIVSRIKVLHKAGCTDINLVCLPEPMTKLESLAYLKNQPLDANAMYAVESKYEEKIKVHRQQILTMTGVSVAAVSQRRVEQFD